MAQTYDVVIKGTGMGIGEQALMDLFILLLKGKIYLLILFFMEKELNLLLKGHLVLKT